VTIRYYASGVAAALEFPDGSMHASGLRREAQHGRLRIWRIAGKDYTAKQALKEMRGQCVLPNHHDSSSAAPAKAAAPSGSSKTGSAKSAQAFGESERRKAEIAFADYLVKNRQPSFGDGHPNQVLIGDCLAVYCEKHGPTIARPDGLALEVERLAEFFGDRFVADVTQERCNEYVEWRCAQTDKRATKSKGRAIKASTAKRELVTLSAALNWCWRNKRLDRPVVVTLPKVSENRERYLKRNEVAGLLWAALGFNQDGTRNRFRINRHLARFILIALYTGTRHDAILRLQWMANTTGGWFNLDVGVLYRRPQDAIETNKRRTPSPIPPRLMPHLKRWRKLSTQYVIEPIASQLRRAWAGARVMAGLGADVTPHVLKHTCATLMLQNKVSTWDVAGVLGTSEAVIRKTYGHHSVEHLRQAVDVWSRRPAIAKK
jgi:integrase